jgi:putative ABC transport system permease protein
VNPLARWLVLTAALAAPAGERGDFRREWLAEIAWRGRGAGVPALGAFVHAAWLRKEQWRLDMIWQDLKFGVRLLLGRPAFTALAVLTLALGIGANTAMFSLVYGVLLKPLALHEPDRLVQLWETNPLRNWTDATASPANVLDWRQRNRSFEGIAFYPGMDNRAPMYGNATLAGGNTGPERIQSLPVSTNFFRVLGVSPALGRDFEEAEQELGKQHVVVLSDAFWRARFGGDPSVLGREIQINERPYRIIGVMPAGFRFPTPEVQLWAPFVMTPQIAQQRRPHYLRPIARLRPGVTVEQGRADMAAIAKALEQTYPDTNTQMGVGLGPLQTFVVGNVRRPLFVFLGAVALVLLIACANLANLLLARALQRRQEFAVRAALGGAGWRLARQLLIESLLLSMAGAAVGVAIGEWTVRLIVRASPGDVPRLDEVALDWRVLLVVATLAFATALLFGLAPAWQAARADVAWLRDGNRRTAAGNTTRRALVIAQIAASVALVGAAGLLLRSFERLQSVSPGFDPDRAIAFRVTLPGAAYAQDDGKAIAFFEELLSRLRTLPGVTAAGGATVIGLDGQGWTGDLFIEGKPDVWGRELRHKEVTSGYFEAMHLPILRGRTFNDRDTAANPAAVIVNEALVRTYFANEEPLGQRLTFGRQRPGNPPPTVWTIVGVVRDEKQNALDEDVKPAVYESHQQNASLGMTVVVRSETPPTSLVPAIRQQLAALDRGVALFDVRSLREVVSESVARQRFTTWIVGVFALLALTIAAVGVYGVISYSVSGRTREIGVRMALGASARSVSALVMREAFVLLATGAAIGLLVCLSASRAIATLLFQTTPTDPVTYGGVIAVMAVVGAAASYVPLRRALRVDPNVALRYE